MIWTCVFGFIILYCSFFVFASVLSSIFVVLYLLDVDLDCTHALGYCLSRQCQPYPRNLPSVRRSLLQKDYLLIGTSSVTSLSLSSSSSLVISHIVCRYGLIGYVLCNIVLLLQDVSAFSVVLLSTSLL